MANYPGVCHTGFCIISNSNEKNVTKLWQQFSWRCTPVPRTIHPSREGFLWFSWFFSYLLFSLSWMREHKSSLILLCHTEWSAVISGVGFFSGVMCACEHSLWDLRECLRETKKKPSMLGFGLLLRLYDMHFLMSSYECPTWSQRHTNSNCALTHQTLSNSIK